MHTAPQKLQISPETGINSSILCQLSKEWLNLWLAGWEGSFTAEQQNHSPVYIVHNVGILVVTQDLDFIHAQFVAALLQETDFLYGHLKQHGKP